MSHTAIFVPSYFDFVRLRNYFKKEDISFAQICEYVRRKCFGQFNLFVCLDIPLIQTYRERERTSITVIVTFCFIPRDITSIGGIPITHWYTISLTIFN